MIDVIILAAGRIKHKLHFANFIYDTPALVPINTRSSISYILDFYHSYPVRIHVICDQKDEKVLYDELTYYPNVNIIALAQTISIVDTLKQALQAVNPSNELIVNVVTTIPTLLAPEDTVLVANTYQTNASWSGIHKDHENNYVFVYKTDSVKTVTQAFTGICRIGADKLKQAIAEVSAQEQDLLTVISEVIKNTHLSLVPIEWVDCGHELNFYDAKAKLISSRSFNTIQIDQTSGVITKSSSNAKKFTEEIRYISLLPKEIAIYYPSIYNEYRNDGYCTAAQMEYYGYPTLAEYMLYWGMENYVWEKIFVSLKHIIEKFSRYQYSIGKSAYLDFYMTKVEERMALFQSQLGSNHNLFKDEIVINETAYSNFHKLQAKIQEKIESLYNENDFCIMHGDLCFNNILYDKQSGIVRLIDARGSFGDRCVGIYGDVKYDLAKLTHSVIGKYDFLVNNLFSININGHSFQYTINERSNYAYLCEENMKLIEDFGFKTSDILLLVGLLFVSMCALHRDDKKRQIAMYLHGIKIINESLT